MNTTVSPSVHTRRAPLHARRVELPGARDDRLYFAQVREDACVELEALAPKPTDVIVTVGSGGCTALSLLAAGAGRVAAVDLNRSQNHLVELKLASAAVLSRAATLDFLGASPATPSARLGVYAWLRHDLTPPARRYWDDRAAAIGQGVLNAGVTERFIAVVMRTLRLGVHSHARIDRMLACTSIREQQELFAREWNTWRWRALFAALLNPVVFRRTYHPEFFAHLDQPSFAAHFRGRAEYTLTNLSVTSNYFLHHMLTGRYPVDAPGGVPFYLDVRAAGRLRERRDNLTLVDGAMTDYLRTLDRHSVSGYVLSNICEWLAPAALDELFAEIARTAIPGARVCFRNFVGWTDVPRRWRSIVVEDRKLGERLMARDRSVVQRRFAICRVHPGSAQC